MSWKHGYYAESGYTYGCYAETSPSRIHWLASLKGFDIPHSGFSYVDLGCGQGLNLISMAALYPDSSFVGIDFMPEHIAHAKRLAQVAGIKNISFYEADFLELESDPLRYGEFDYAIAHGISTWIGPSIRKALFHIASRSLKPGGIFYNSYNTYPGWLSATPLQNLVLLMQRSRNGLAALQASGALLKELKECGSSLFDNFPSLEARLGRLDQQDPSYLVQEYNNHYWQPVHCNEMLELAEANKLSFLCSATIPEVFDGCYKKEIINLINSQTDPVIRETVRDLALCQSFRRDLYIKGGASLWPLKKLQQIGEQCFIATRLKPIPNNNENFSFQAGAIRIEGRNEAYARLIEDFGDNGNSIDAVLSLNSGLAIGSLLQMVGLLIQGGWLAHLGDTSSAASLSLNEATSKAALDGAPYQYLCFPRLLSSFGVENLDMLMLGLLANNTPTPDLSAELCTAMSKLNKNFLDNGTAIINSSDAKRKSDLVTSEFLRDRLPNYQRLGAWRQA